MSVARHAVKLFYAVLLILSLTVVSSAQNIAELKKQAAAGDAKAQYSLGVAYANGYGVSEDKSEALRWWRKAADQGYAEAQFSLGAAYRDGAGVQKDNAEAYFWLSLAATGKVEGMKPEDLAKARDEQAFHLTKTELSQVQERVQKWVKDHVAKTNSQ